jgi:hypothetical protein
VFITLSDLGNPLTISFTECSSVLKPIAGVTNCVGFIHLIVWKDTYWSSATIMYKVILLQARDTYISHVGVELSAL